MTVLAAVAALVAGGLAAVALRVGLHGNANRQGWLNDGDVADVVWVGGASAGLLVGIGWASYGSIPSMALPLLAALGVLLLLLTVSLVGEHYLRLDRRSFRVAVLLVGLLPAVVWANAASGSPTDAAPERLVLLLVGIPLALAAAGVVIGRCQRILSDSFVSIGMAAITAVALAIVAWMEQQAAAAVMLLAGLGALTPMLRSQVSEGAPSQMALGAVWSYGWAVLLVLSTVFGGYERAGVLVAMPFLLGNVRSTLRRSMWLCVAIVCGFLAVGVELWF